MKTKSNAGTQKKLDGSGKKVVRNTSNRLKVQQSLIKKQSDEIARLRSLLLGELKNKRGLWSLSSVGPQPHKPFKCEKCDATFTRKDKVARHIREIHEGIKRARNVAKEKLRNRSGESARRWAKMKEQHDLDPELKKKRQLEVAERTKLYRPNTMSTTTASHYFTIFLRKRFFLFLFSIEKMLIRSIQNGQ